MPHKITKLLCKITIIFVSSFYQFIITLILSEKVCQKGPFPQTNWPYSRLFPMDILLLGSTCLPPFCTHITPWKDYMAIFHFFPFRSCLMRTIPVNTCTSQYLGNKKYMLSSFRKLQSSKTQTELHLSYILYVRT